CAFLRSMRVRQDGACISTRCPEPLSGLGSRWQSPATRPASSAHDGRTGNGGLIGHRHNRASGSGYGDQGFPGTVN
ncbi:hypothetical protein SB717_36450, partial [Priestia sp. SIMBA_032]|uniref:hypothetical protein n=1 Tax=Priestia sp. SIMBA_032 TaxID=3085775 RepID=UPI003979B952